MSLDLIPKFGAKIYQYKLLEKLDFKHLISKKYLQLLKKSVELYQAVPKELHHTEELQNLARLLPEQMHDTGKNLIPKEDEETR